MTNSMNELMMITDSPARHRDVQVLLIDPQTPSNELESDISYKLRELVNQLSEAELAILCINYEMPNI